MFYVNRCKNPNFLVQDNNVFWKKLLIKDVDAQTFCAKGDIISVDSKNVFIGDSRFEDADPKSFERIADNYFEDINNVYWFTHKIKEASLDNFEIIGDRYSRSGEYVFYQDQPIAGVDAKTFVYLFDHYAKDANHYYDLGRVTNSVPHKSENKSTGITNYLEKIKNHILSVFEIILNRDFVFINPPVRTEADIILDKTKNNYQSWIVNGNRAFYQGAEFPAKDPGSLKALNTIYAIDNIAVYAQGGEIVGADPKTFQLVETPYNEEVFSIAKDAHAVYDGGIKINGLDPNTLKVVGFYLFDRNNIYYNNQKIENSAAVIGEQFRTIEPSGVYVLIGDNHIISFGKIYTKSIISNYKMISRTVWTDGENVYSQSEKINGADAATFQVNDNSYYMIDKNNVYYGGNTLVGDDSKNLKILSPGYGGFIKTSKYVAYDGQRITTADPSTFQMVNGERGCAKDKKQYYIMDKIVSEKDFEACLR